MKFIVEPTVTLIAHTQLSPTLMYHTEFQRDASWLPWNPSENSREPEDVIEFAGRACYQSWNRPNPKTASNADYIKHIIDVGHESVLEHASATFYIEGVSRALTHELVRHRHLSFSQLSQRYVDESDASWVVPPALIPTDYPPREGVDQDDVVSINKDAYIATTNNLVRQGLRRKQAREAARAYLTNGTETKIVVTGNFRAWRHVVKLRGSEHADAEIRRLMSHILPLLKGVAPSVFDDIEVWSAP